MLTHAFHYTYLQAQLIFSCAWRVRTAYSIFSELLAVVYLDVSLDLNTSSYSLYNILNEKLPYIQRQSCYPSVIIKSLKANISTSVSNLSTSRENVESVATFYKRALANSDLKE